MISVTNAMFMYRFNHLETLLPTNGAHAMIIKNTNMNQTIKQAFDKRS